MFQHKSDSDALDAIVRDINSYKNDGSILLCGDLNSRTGSDTDFIINDDDDDGHIPLDPDYIIDAKVTKRESEDSKVDERGKQLNEVCIASRLRILNGRTLGDLLGQFTCQKPTGASVVDYFIASEEILKNVIYFHFHPFLPIFSDCHSKISMSFKAPYVKESKQNINKKMPATFKWNKVSSEKIINALQDKDMSNKIRLFMEKKSWFSRNRYRSGM